MKKVCITLEMNLINVGNILSFKIFAISVHIFLCLPSFINSVYPLSSQGKLEPIPCMCMWHPDVFTNAQAQKYKSGFKCPSCGFIAYLIIYICAPQNCFELFIPDNKDQVIKACKTEADGRVVEGNHTFYRISAPTTEEKDEWINSIKWVTHE